MRTIDENASISERIRFYRMKRNMNGDMLAELIGVSRYAIMDYENNQTELLLSYLKNIAAVLEIEVDKLFDNYYKFLDYPYSEKIKQIRTNNSLLQREMGEMLGVGRRTIERWEHGENKVSREIWEQLKALNLL